MSTKSSIFALVMDKIRKIIRYIWLIIGLIASIYVLLGLILALFSFIP